MNQTDEWYRTERLSPNVIVLDEGNHRRMVAVDGAERSYVIDAGVGLGNLFGFASELLLNKPVQLLTHAHWDHIGNAAQFDEVHVHEAELTDDVVAVAFEKRPSEFVQEWRTVGNRFPDGFDPETYSIDPVEATTHIPEGKVFWLGNRELESLHLPGHTPGHVGFLDRDEELLYAGDLIHRNRGLYLHLPGSDIGACLQSLQVVGNLREEQAFDTLVTSHNPPIQKLEIIDTLIDGVRSIIDGNLNSTEIDSTWGPKEEYVFEGILIKTHPQ